MFWIIVGLAVLFLIEVLSPGRAKSNSSLNGNEKVHDEDSSEKDRARRQARMEKSKNELLKALDDEERKSEPRSAESNEDRDELKGVEVKSDSRAQFCISKDPAQLLLARKITDRINRAIQSKSVALTVVLRQLDIVNNSGTLSQAFVSQSGFLWAEFQGVSKQKPGTEVEAALNASSTSAIELSGDPKTIEAFRLLNVQNIIDDWKLKDSSFLADRLMLALKSLLRSDPTIISDLEKVFPIRGSFDFELTQKPSDNLKAAKELINKLHGITGKRCNYILNEAKSSLEEIQKRSTSKNLEQKNESRAKGSSNTGMDLFSSSLERAVLKRGVPYITHFTTVSNLPSIFQNGLLSRGALDQSGQAYALNDQLRLDARPMGISLSIGFPNFKMFFKYRIQDKQKKWAVIRVDPSVLWEKNCLFFQKNAANGKMIHVREDLLKGKEAFELMYSERVDDIERIAEQLRIYDPTDPQAEVMVFGEIPMNKVIDVVFDDENLMKHFSSRFPKLTMVYNPDFFQSRDNARRREIGY